MAESNTLSRLCFPSVPLIEAIERDENRMYLPSIPTSRSSSPTTNDKGCDTSSDSSSNNEPENRGNGNDDTGSGHLRHDISDTLHESRESFQRSNAPSPLSREETPVIDGVGESRDQE
jgi:hypothetical protein